MNGNNVSNRHDSIDSHASTDDGLDHRSVTSRLILYEKKNVSEYVFFCFYRILPPPAIRLLPLANSNQTNPTRQLPSLPTRQLPTTNPSNSSSAYFDLPNDDEEHEEKEDFTHTGELYYYQTSSSSSSNSNSNDSSTSEHSDQDNNEERFQTDQQDEYDEEEDDDENDKQHQRLQSDEDDEQTSPFEYDA